MIFRNRAQPGVARSARVHFRNSGLGESHFTYGINVAHAWLCMQSTRITIPIQTNRIARKSIHRSVHLDMRAARASLMYKNAPVTHSPSFNFGTSFHRDVLTQIRKLVIDTKRTSRIIMWFSSVIFLFASISYIDGLSKEQTYIRTVHKICSIDESYNYALGY